MFLNFIQNFLIQKIISQAHFSASSDADYKVKIDTHTITHQSLLFRKPIKEFTFLQIISQANFILFFYSERSFLLLTVLAKLIQNKKKLIQFYF